MTATSKPRRASSPLDAVQLGDVVVGTEPHAIAHRLVGERALLQLRFPAGQREPRAQVLGVGLVRERACLQPEPIAVPSPPGSTGRDRLGRLRPCRRRAASPPGRGPRIARRPCRQATRSGGAGLAGAPSPPRRRAGSCRSRTAACRRSAFAAFAGSRAPSRDRDRRRPVAGTPSIRRSRKGRRSRRCAMPSTSPMNTPSSVPPRAASRRVRWTL